MGILKNGIFGPVSGKVGQQVFSMCNGVQCVRSLPQPTTKSPTIAMLEQRAKFALAIDFVRCINGLLKVTFRQYNKKRNPSNVLMSIILQTAITGDYPHFAIDYSEVPVSLGHLVFPPFFPTLSVSEGMLHWQWKSMHASTRINPRDRAILVVYCPALDVCHYELGGPERSSNKATLDVTAFKGQSVVTWLAFMAENGKNTSDSVFTGQVVVD